MLATCGLLFYYIIVIVGLLKNNLSQVVHSENTVTPKAIKFWILFLSGILFLIAIRVMFGFYLRISANVFDSRNMELIWVSAILWLLLFTRIIISPEILYGFNVQIPIQQTINQFHVNNDIVEIKVKEKEKEKETNKELNFNRWSNYPLKEMNNPNDIKLFSNIEDKLSDYFKKIDNVFSQYEVVCKNDFDLEMLASMVKIPISHVKFIFKYCSQLSFINYRKKIQINFATILIKSGYLKRNTLDSLSKYVGFSSYTPFYYAFKEIIGISPQEF
jgi:AraC-like DNA-binding protein